MFFAGAVRSRATSNKLASAGRLSEHAGRKPVCSRRIPEIAFECEDFFLLFGRKHFRALPEREIVRHTIEVDPGADQSR